MTITELRMLYKQDTGERTPQPNLFNKTYIPRVEQEQLLAYMEWLEEKVIHFQTQMDETHKLKYGG